LKKAQETTSGDPTDISEVNVSHKSSPDWSQLIDDVLLVRLVDYANRSQGKVQTAYLAGSYVRGTWNPERPNVNVYFIASLGAAASVRGDLSRTFAEIREHTREHGVDFMVDCHPFTISQRDTAWLEAPLLTLTTKVFDGAYADAQGRLLLSPVIGHGWWATHRVLHGDVDALRFLEEPSVRNEDWFRGAHAALCHYRNVIDHLPWAIDPAAHTERFVEETYRYAEETIKDGVNFGSTDEEIADSSNFRILHSWAPVGREFYGERYGPQGVWAVDAVASMKTAMLRGGNSVDDALSLWHDAMAVWLVVWSQYLRLVSERGLGDDLRRVMSWM
jgi:hypothetical protein